MRKLVAVALFLLASSVSSAVTLEEALISGYTNHEDLKIIRADFLTEIERFPNAVAGFMPRVSLGLSGTDSKTTRKNDSSVPPRQDAVTNDSNIYSKTVTLEQSIFSGGSSVAELKAAQSSFRSSKHSYYAREQSILFDEITAYLNCVEALEKYNISSTSVKSNKTQLEAIKEKFRLGESTETEIASAEAGLAIAEANRALALADLEAAKANFTRVFSIEAIDVKMPPTPAGLPNNLNEFIEKAQATNPNIQAAHHGTKTSRAEEYIAKAALLPQVSFQVQNGETYYSPETPNTSAINNNSLTSTLSVKVPILSRGGAEYSDIRRAKYKTRKSVLQLDGQIKQISSNCKATWEAFNATKTRIDASSQGVKSAEVAYNGMMQEELLGTKTIIDVLVSEERLNQARQAKVEAEKELILAGYRIKALMGELTAEKMKLPIRYFNPDEEFKKIKLKIIGF